MEWHPGRQTSYPGRPYHVDLRLDVGNAIKMSVECKKCDISLWRDTTSGFGLYYVYKYELACTELPLSNGTDGITDGQTYGQAQPYIPPFHGEKSGIHWIQNWLDSGHPNGHVWIHLALLINIFYIFSLIILNNIFE